MDHKMKLLLLFGSILLILGTIVLGGRFMTTKSSIDQIKEASVSQTTPVNNKKPDLKNANLKHIYLAGGCFWGVEEYFSRVNGVIDAVSGYANGNSETTNYELISQTKHAETVHVTYDANKISLREILLHYFRIIDPTSKNKQGNDRGPQYRTGVYYQDQADITTINQVFEEQSKKFKTALAVEKEPLKQFIKAEEYHQDYLKKNPNGYCHINVKQATYPVIDAAKYKKPSDDEIRKNMR